MQLNQEIVAAGLWRNLVDYQVIEGNAVWRFALLLAVVVLGLAGGRVVQFALNTYAAQSEKKKGVTVLSLMLKCLSKPAYVAIFALAFYLCRLCLVFEDPSAEPPRPGISVAIAVGWARIAKAIGAIAVAYAIFKLVDVAEHYLVRWTGKTETKLDDMLVPVIRKSLRVTIAIIAVIYIVDNVLQQDVESILLSAGVGGIAVALAARETIANFFGSITIFADRPFQINELVRINGHFGPIEEVGFRSTRLRTLEGHLVTIPNSIIANSIVENVGRRRFIRRTSNITITYDSGHTKAERAVEIIKDILGGIPQLNGDPDTPPRVYFNEFNDWSLNIYMSYWYRPGDDWWGFQQVNQQVNLEMMKRFEAEGIEFAFPTQTLHLKKD